MIDLISFSLSRKFIKYIRISDITIEERLSNSEVIIIIIIIN